MKLVNNQLSKVYKLAAKLPEPVRRTLLSATFGRVVPFAGTAGVKFEDFGPLKVTVSLDNKRSVRNHIGQIHAVAMMLLGETATGFVVGINTPDTHLCLVKDVKVRFKRPSKGAMQATATLTEAMAEQIQTTERGEVTVPCEITDASGQAPIEVDMTWAWVSKASLKKRA